MITAMRSSRVIAPSLPSLGALVGLLTLSACGSEGSGTLQVTTWGEDYIETEIPAASGGGDGFVDGWTVRYDKFLVTFGDLQVADRDGNLGTTLPAQRVFDLHAKGPHAVHQATLEARRWDRVGISVLGAVQASAGNASAADVKLMNDKGTSVYVEGAATKGAQTVTFAWGFTTATSYGECREETSGEGVAVPTGGTATIQFTIHGDHFFYDDLQSQDPSLRFEAIAAADANADGHVTLDELAQVDLTSLPLGQYGTGGDGSVTNLAGFLAALSRTLVHYQGEGHCHSGTP